MAKGKVAGAIIGGLVGIGLIAGIVFAVSNKGGGLDVPPPPQPQTQLAMVQNIEYDYKDGLLTWDEVEHADSYNVKVDNGEEQKVNSTYYTFNLENDVTYFQIQACDTTGNYKASEWTEPYAVTKIKEDESLVDAVNNFARSIAIKGNELDKIISVMPEGNYLVTTGVYEFDGEKYLLTDYTDCGKPVESLKEALKPLRAEIRSHGLLRRLGVHLAQNVRRQPCGQHVRKAHQQHVLPPADAADGRIFLRRALDDEAGDDVGGHAAAFVAFHHRDRPLHSVAVGGVVRGVLLARRGEIRLHVAGQHRGHLYPEGSKLVPHRGGEGGECGFCRGVEGLEGDGELRSHRAHVDDGAAASLAHDRDDLSAHAQRSEEVELEYLAHGGFVGVLRGTRDAHAGVVDKDVYPAVLFLHRADGALHRLAVRDVGGDAVEFRRFSAGEAHHFRALLLEKERRRFAYPCGRAGDDDHLVFSSVGHETDLTYIYFERLYNFFSSYARRTRG